MESKQFDCSHCAWKTDALACQICKQGTGGSFKDIDAMIAEQPLQFRSELPTKDELWQSMCDDLNFQNYLVLTGEEHQHYIINHIDECEWVGLKWGHQN